MDDLSKSFVIEANELLESLEEALLKLENHPDDQEEINTAFRVMHSLKGTGAMFGFDELSTFTHEMESLYDLVRSGKRKPDKELIDFTFKSIDLVRKLLDKPDDAETLTMKQALLEELKSKFPMEETNISSKEKETTLKKLKTKPKKKKYPATWYIHFEPHCDILKNGTRPLYLLDELAEAGKIRTFLHTKNLPGFEHLIVENVYVSWDMLIATDKEKSFLKDVFIFVEDASLIKIEKLSENDLLAHPDFENQVEALELAKSITPEKMHQLTAALFFPEKEKTPQPEEVAEKESAEEPESDLKPAGKPEDDDVQQKILHETVRVPSAKLDELLDIISELVTTQARLLHYSHHHEDPELEDIAEAYEKLSRQLRENALGIRLIPIYTILIRFKRLVRDLSSQMNKEITLKTTGTETELDKSIIEKLYDPLMHVLRNSIDHGIETAEERIKTGKPVRGLIHIETSYIGACVQIKISDDGRGMDEEELKKAAVEKGFIKPGAEISRKELLQLIFQPGFTTSKKVSNVSGRGVGMNVVKKNIEDLRGSIELETEKDRGTTVKILLPLTLSIIDGLLIYVGNSRYIIPMNNIKQVYQVTRKELQSTFNNVITKEKYQIPFVDLVKEFGEKDIHQREMYLIVVIYGKREMGFVINAVAGKYQAVIKPLSHIVQKQGIFSGASVLGDGEIALVIDTNKMIHKFINN
ncbi:MAG: chemotaxis protein CheA [bacterium]|nr:MAG: chemotaxis protein CheA [bacterium]